MKYNSSFYRQTIFVKNKTRIWCGHAMNTDRVNKSPAVRADSNGGESVIRKNDKLIKLEPDIKRSGCTKTISNVVSTTKKLSSVHPQTIKIEPIELSPTTTTTTSSTITNATEDGHQTNIKGQDNSNNDDKFSG